MKLADLSRACIGGAYSATGINECRSDFSTTSAIGSILAAEIRMNRIFLLIVGPLFLTGLKPSAQCVKDYTPKSADEAEIVRLENEWCDVAVKRDAVRLSNIFAGDITWIEDTGYRNKREVLHRYMAEIQ
jgi:hypothetical protein